MDKTKVASGINNSSSMVDVSSLIKDVTVLSRAQRPINLEIPVLVPSLKSSDVELG